MFDIIRTVHLPHIGKHIALHHGRRVFPVRIQSNYRWSRYRIFTTLPVIDNNGLVMLGCQIILHKTRTKDIGTSMIFTMSRQPYIIRRCLLPQFSGILWGNFFDCIFFSFSDLWNYCLHVSYHVMFVSFLHRLQRNVPVRLEKESSDMKFLIAHDSEVITFSLCVFVCVRHYVCRDDLDMKDW